MKKHAHAKPSLDSVPKHVPHLLTYFRFSIYGCPTPNALTALNETRPSKAARASRPRPPEKEADVDIPERSKSERTPDPPYTYCHQGASSRGAKTAATPEAAVCGCLKSFAQPTNGDEVDTPVFEGVQPSRRAT